MADEYRPKNDEHRTSSKNELLLGYSGNSRRVLTGFIIIAGLVGLGAFGLYAYNKGKDAGRSNIPPIIKPKEGPTKVRPDHPGGMKVPNRDKEVFRRFDEKNPRSTVEIILSAPEEPLRPNNTKEKNPVNQGLSGRNNGPLRKKHEAPLIKKKISIMRNSAETASSDAAAIKNSETKDDVGQKAFKGKKRFKIQIASLRSLPSVKKTWRLISKKHSDLLGTLALNIERKNLGDVRGVYYRMQAGPVNTRVEAQALCAKLKARGVSCIVVGG